VAHLEQVVAQDFGRLVEQGLGGRHLGAEVLGHADSLRPLAGEESCHGRLVGRELVVGSGADRQGTAAAAGGSRRSSDAPAAHLLHHLHDRKGLQLAAGVGLGGDGLGGRADGC
jgi:hypothetical protein